MFKKNETSEEKFQRRADLLYPTTNDKKNLTKSTNKLGEPKTNNIEQVKKEIKKSTNNNRPQTEKNAAEILDMFYPTMKNKNDKKQEKIETKNILVNKTNQTKIKNDIKQNNSIDLNKNYKETDKKFEFHNPQNIIAVDYINNKYIKKVGKLITGKEAVENLHMSKEDSYLNTEYSKEHKIYDNYKQLNGEMKNYIKEKLTKQLELKNTPEHIREEKLKNVKGIYINENSESSKALAKTLINNKEFKEKLVNARKSMENGISINDNISFKDKNFHNAIGLGDIRNMHINKNGDIELDITDTYDFNKNDKNDLVKVGRERQEKGKIKPYFIIYHVIIPKKSKIE